MRIISLRRLREFWREHGDAESVLLQWYRVARSASWRNLQEVRRQYPTADGVTVKSVETMTVFNIGGNKYRLITNIWYRGQQVYIKLVFDARRV